MRPWVYRLTQLKWQMAIAAVPVGAAALCLSFPKHSGVDLSSLDRSTFITTLSAVATILALFCSMSITWIPFVSQQNKSERIAAYDTLKLRLLEAQRWLLTQPDNEDRTVCLSLAYELEKLDLSDLPQTDRESEYAAYCKFLEEGLDSNDQARREFYLISSTHFGYIEHLLNRVGLVAIRQIIAKLFIDTLAKGVGLVAVAVTALIVSTLWFNEFVKAWLVLVTGFCGVASVFLLFEVWIDLQRHYNEEVDFIEHTVSPERESQPR